jgi:hypothetical protein
MTAGLTRCTVGQSGSDKGAHLMIDGREFDRQGVYQIGVKAKLDPKWSDWFDGLTVTPQADDKTLLAGSVADQAALHGLLAKIRDLGLPLLFVKQVEDEPST